MPRFHLAAVTVLALIVADYGSEEHQPRIERRNTNLEEAEGRPTSTGCLIQRLAVPASRLAKDVLFPFFLAWRRVGGWFNAHDREGIVEWSLIQRFPIRVT